MKTLLLLNSSNLALSSAILSSLLLFSGCGGDSSTSTPSSPGTNNPLTTNSAPVITSSVTTSLNENTTSVLQVTATDSDNNTLTYSISGTDSNLFSINSVSGLISFKNAPDFEAPHDNGTDNIYNITVGVNDGTLSATQALAITVADLAEAGGNVNTPPVATFNAFSTLEDSAKNVQLTATDTNNDTLTYSIITNPTHGTASVNTNGAVTYTPATNYFGNDTFTYKVNDGVAFSNAQIVNITVSSVDDAPVATFQGFSLFEDQSYSHILNYSDTENDSATAWNFVSTVTHGTATISSNGTLSYIPNANYTGTDSFSYNITAGGQTSANQIVNITVNGQNDTPTIDSTYSNINFDMNKGITNFELNVSDVDGDDLNVTVDSNDTSIITVTENWTNLISQANYDGVALDFNLTTEVNATGIVEITITVNDASLNNSRTFDVNVTNPALRPFTSGDSWKGKVYNTVISGVTSKVWLDRNLGATQVCTTQTDTACYGDYYQWGRDGNGYEVSNSPVITSRAYSIAPSHTSFIQVTNAYTRDWTTSSVDRSGALRESNWSKTDGTSICPTGFRVPTATELFNERGLTKYAVTGRDLFLSALKIPSAGFRNGTTATMNSVGAYPYLWSVSPLSLGTDQSYAFQASSSANTTGENRKAGMSVRCIKN